MQIAVKVSFDFDERDYTKQKKTGWATLCRMPKRKMKQNFVYTIEQKGAAKC
jgi:hypothetical protein